MRNFFKSLLIFCFVLVPFSVSEAALTVAATSITTDGAMTINGVAASTYTIGAATTTGTITIGGTAQTGAIAIGDTASSTVSEISIGGGNGPKTAINIADGTGASTINIGTGATGVNTINIGTGNASNVITIGSTASGLRYFEENETMTSDDVLTIGESGKTFYIGTAGVDLTLPAVSTANGVWYRFIISGNFALTDATIVTDSGENVIEGAIYDGIELIQCETEDTVTFLNFAEIIGDFVELRSNGTNWFISGQTYTQGGITCSWS